MKNIQMNVKTTTVKNGTEIIVTYEARLESKDLSFNAIAQFNEDVEKLNKLLKIAIKRNAFTEFIVLTYEYNVDSNDYYESMRHDTYREWVYTGYPQDDSCEFGYYLQPNIKYTPEHHDMVYDYTLESITA